MRRIQECEAVSGCDLISVVINWCKGYLRSSRSQPQFSSCGSQEVTQSGALLWAARLPAQSFHIITHQFS